MTEKLDLDDEFDSSLFTWNDDEVETNVSTAEDDGEFVRSITGQSYETTDYQGPTPTRESDEKSDSQSTLQQIHDKYNQPRVTSGGKKIRVVKDEWGTFWHVEFMSGGQLPAELSGSFTTPEAADLAVTLYLARQE
jgi:hypothetical protein